MLELGIQTKNIVYDENPFEGFKMLKGAGFSCGDFSLNGYLLNTDIYKSEINSFFDKTVQELEAFFTPHKLAAKKAGIRINQLHMPYPIFYPQGSKELNEYLWNVVAPKSMKICAFLESRYIVIHGFNLAYYLGSEAAEWVETQKFIDSIAPLAKELGLTICIENLYTSVAGHLVEGNGCNQAKVMERIDYFNEKYGAVVLGFCFDTGHANLVGLDFESFLTALDYRLKVLHIHDNDGISDLHQIPFTFTRTRENKACTDWDGFIKGLRNIKFNGVLSFETAPVLSSFPEEMKQDALGFIAKIGTYFAKEIEA